jgi:N-methylhydantoinase B
LPTISGWRDGRPFVFCETFMGNTGASCDHDGEEGVAHIGANQSNVPVEMIEAEYPIRIEHYGIAPDTGGPGRFRGGLSLVRSYRVLAEEAGLNVRSDKRKHPPHGLYGGGAGAASMNRVHRGNGVSETLPVLLTRTVPMRKGDLFHHVMAGGGGYGDPLDRDAGLVLQDVIEEKVSRAHAEQAYGVVMAAGPEPAVDAAATEALRTRLRRARQS